MKRLLKAIFLMAWSVNAATVADQKTPVFSERTIQNIKDIEGFFDKNTMIIFDIDEVLLRASQDANERSLVEGWDTQELFSAAKAKAHSVICLTSRYASDKEYTIQELATRGITFDNTFTDIFKYDNYSLLVLPSGESIMYSGGIIFTSAFNKGLALAEFLASLPQGRLPEKIIFVDDLATNLESVKNLFAPDAINPKGPYSVKEYQEALSRIPAGKVKEIRLFHYTRVESEKGTADKQ